MSKHRSDLKFCGCRACTYGMRTKAGGWLVQYARRRQRRAVKHMLRMGWYDTIDTRWPVPYTD